MSKNILPRDRVISAINFKETDICPYYIWIDKMLIEPLGLYYGDTLFYENYICNHSCMTEIKSAERPLTDNTFTDDFGTLWKKGNLLHVESPALRKPDLAGYRFPDISTDIHFEGIDEWLDSLFRQGRCNRI